MITCGVTVFLNVAICHIYVILRTVEGVVMRKGFVQVRLVDPTKMFFLFYVTHEQMRWRCWTFIAVFGTPHHHHRHTLTHKGSTIRKVMGVWGIFLLREFFFSIPTWCMNFFSAVHEYFFEFFALHEFFFHFFCLARTFFPFFCLARILFPFFCLPRIYFFHHFSNGPPPIFPSQSMIDFLAYFTRFFNHTYAADMLLRQTK